MPNDEAGFRAVVLRKLADMEDKLNSLMTHHNEWMARQDRMLRRFESEYDENEWWKEGREPPW